MSFSAACPKDYMPPKHIIEFGEKYGNGKFEIVTDPLEAAKNADVVYTDVWASMGQEEEKKIREAAFAGYQVNKELMAGTNKDCMVLHCLPAHRGERLLQIYLKNTQTKSLRRQKTVFTLRRLFLLNVWQMKCLKKFDDSLIL